MFYLLEFCNVQSLQEFNWIRRFVDANLFNRLANPMEKCVCKKYGIKRFVILIGTTKRLIPNNEEFLSRLFIRYYCFYCLRLSL